MEQGWYFPGARKSSRQCASQGQRAAQAGEPHVHNQELQAAAVS